MLKGLVFVLVALILCKHALCKQKDDWWDNLGRFMTEKTEGLKGFVTGGSLPLSLLLYGSFLSLSAPFSSLPV